MSHLVIPLLVTYSTEVIPMDTEMYIQRIHIVSDREKQTKSNCKELIKLWDINTMEYYMIHH